MGYLIALDASLTMGLSCHGKPIKHNEEKSRFRVAADVITCLVDKAVQYDLSPSVNLFRIGEFYEDLGEVEREDDILGRLITKADGSPAQLYGRSNMSDFMAHIHKEFAPSTEDKIIIVTDCSTFEGDTNYCTGCETRFIIVNSNKDTMSEIQLEELDEIAAQSIGHEASPENEHLYHHFFVSDFPSMDELVSTVIDELFYMSVYQLRLGNLTTMMKIEHPFYRPGLTTVHMIGFTQPSNLNNMQVVSCHYIHPVYTENDVEELKMDVSDSSDDEEDTAPSSTSITPPPPPPVLPPVPVPAKAPRVNFFPPGIFDSKPLTTPVPSLAPIFINAFTAPILTPSEQKVEMEREREEQRAVEERMDDEDGEIVTVKKSKKRRHEETGDNDEIDEDWLTDLARRALSPSDPDIPTAPMLLQCVTAACKAMEVVALCYLNTGEYAAIYTEPNDGGEDVAVIAVLQDQHYLPSYIPDLAKLRAIFDEEAKGGSDLQIRDYKLDPSSYATARTSWFNEAGFDADMGRIKKHLRKIPERLGSLYSDVNRMRMHAYATCNTNALPILAAAIVDEAEQVGPIAVQHANHISRYYNNIVPISQLEDIPILRK